MTNRVALSLAPRDTDSCLATLRAAGSRIELAEIRLDLMDSFDLPRLIAEAPCGLIITCRPPREGGRFGGSEIERLAILRQALELGCAYVDVEWDSIELLERPQGAAGQVMVSRHWFDRMPESLWLVYETLRDRADVVKLVGLAQQPTEMLPVLELLQRATTPVVAIAMGAAGQLTRLIAPCYEACLLTYAAAATTSATASGQYSLQELIERYHLDRVGPHTELHLHLCADDESARAAAERNAGVADGAVLYAPLVLAADQIEALAPGLRANAPRLTLSADPPLQAALQRPS
jgi:3-dehydroquinate dehydratase/shikimate dehydrogenase